MPSTLGIVAGGVWTPAELPGVVGWWDADDAATFTYSSGTSVSQWNSKVNSYNLVQSTELQQPTRSGTINGRSSVVFDGSNDFLSVASFDMTGGQKLSVAMVFSKTSGGTPIPLEHSALVDNNPGSFGVFPETNNTVSFLKKGGGVQYSIFTTSGTVSTTPKVFVGTHDGTLTANETSAWLDGSGAGTRPSDPNTNANNISATLYVGSRGGTTRYLNGQIAEMVITTTVLSATERETLQNYLKNRWGTA